MLRKPEFMFDKGLFYIIFFALKITTTAAFAVQPISIRDDIQQKLHQQICAQKQLSIPAETWRLGIYDLQLEGKRIQKGTTPKVDERFLVEESMNLAKRYNHNGMIWGKCGDGTGWVASLPAPVPIKFKDNMLIVPVDQMTQKCRSVSIDFADAEGGRARNIKIPKGSSPNKEMNINLSFLSNGVLSLSCIPKTPSWQGPVIWHMIPIKKGPKIETPHAPLLSASGSDAEKLTKWLNEIRNEHGLKPLSLDQSMVGKQSQLLVNNGTMIHNRKLTKQVKFNLKKNHMKLIGENRVRGRLLKDLAWLLWISPRHRDLLLSPKATHIGISTAQVGVEKFAVLLFTYK